MPTFLTTSKMDPALAARVEASVYGRGSRTVAESRRSATRMRRAVAVARFVFVLVVIFGSYAVVTAKRAAARALEEARSKLLSTVAEQAASVRAEDWGAVDRMSTWIEGLARGYDGDVVTREIAAPGALAATLARPTVYVRGQADSLGSPPSISAAAAASAKDALLVCLVDPPQERTERAMTDRVRLAYGGGPGVEAKSPSVRRLNDAIVGLPLLRPAWSEKVRAAEDATALARLRRELERAPIERAKQAARAELLLVALDEPGAGDGPTELDGERRHTVRLALVDLVANRVLLRARHAVDPSWVTPQRRATYASGFDGCAFALDVHEDVRRAAGR